MNIPISTTVVFESEPTVIAFNRLPNGNVAINTFVFGGYTDAKEFAEFSQKQPDVEMVVFKTLDGAQIFDNYSHK
jgi:hypothetical protein